MKWLPIKIFNQGDMYRDIKYIDDIVEEQALVDTIRGKLQNFLYIETDFYQNWVSVW